MTEKNILDIDDSRFLETFRRKLFETTKGQEDYTDEIEISKIPWDDLKLLCKDYSLLPTPLGFDESLDKMFLIKEAFGDIQPPDNVTNQIIKKYGLNNTLVYKIEHHNKIYVYIINACIGHNDKVIEDDMNDMGYFLSVRGKKEIRNGILFQALQFEPYSQMQDDETNNVKAKYKTLYHWTPKYNLGDIMANGLVPSHKNEVFNYPPRTYLMKGDCDNDKIAILGQRLCFVNHNPQNDGNYVLLAINITNLDDNIRFYLDPNSDIGIYTEQVIPKNNISIKDNVQFKTKLNL